MRENIEEDGEEQVVTIRKPVTDKWRLGEAGWEEVSERSEEQFEKKGRVGGNEGQGEWDCQQWKFALSNLYGECALQ